MTTNAIQTHQLTKHYPNFQLGPLNLNIPTGAIYGLIGPNGAGKTTALDLILGIIPRQSGHITILNQNLDTHQTQIKQHVAYMTPELSYNAWRKVQHAIQFLRGFYKNWDQNYCTQLLAKFKINPNQRIQTLSFGNKTKLALTLALAQRPQILILDEPTIGIDAPAKREIFSQLLNILKNKNHTILIASHHLADLERFTDHIAILNNGQLILQGNTQEILESHRHIDFNLHNTNPPPNAHLIQHHGTHHRILTNQPQHYQQQLKTLGADPIITKPITLEELLIGLIEGKQL